VDSEEEGNRGEGKTNVNREHEKRKRTQQFTNLYPPSFFFFSFFLFFFFLFYYFSFFGIQSLGDPQCPINSSIAPPPNSRLIVGMANYRRASRKWPAPTPLRRRHGTAPSVAFNLTDKSKDIPSRLHRPRKNLYPPQQAPATPPTKAIAPPALARERIGLSNWIKLEVSGDEKTLFPTPNN